MREGIWETPLGEVPVDSDLAGDLLEASSLAEPDAETHREEHSLEVQLPFILFFRQDISIVPVCVRADARLEQLMDFGQALAAVVRRAGEEVLIVASTDMSHYVDQETARNKDFSAIKKVLDLDPDGLYKTVLEERISMCGLQPTVAALAAAKDLGASRAELVKYQTSGDVSGDFQRVVGYAGIRVLAGA